MTRPAFRFAPSPNGRLHLGHGYSALLNADLASRVGGRFLVRIEDIDTLRCRREFEHEILRDLAWLGLTWERPVRRQSESGADYAAAAGRLRRRGLLYPCFCSRREAAAAVAAFSDRTDRPAPRDPDGAPLYPGTCRSLAPAERERRLAAGTAAAWRIDMAAAAAAASGPLGFVAVRPDGAEEPVAARPERWGDAVIVRRDIPTSYHLAVVVDDALQGVTDVVRGLDLLAATDLHVLLQVLLGFSTPRYRHHRLISDPFGDKLAKSRGSESLADLRRRGVTAAAIRARLGFPPQPEMPST